MAMPGTIARQRPEKNEKNLITQLLKLNFKRFNLCC
jgi:hypothetical protein